LTAKQIPDVIPPIAFRISDLCTLLESYLEIEQVKEIYRAYLFGAEAHDGQHRRSGEPYITHPLEVAKILADMRMDPQSIIAAILHDVIEDTPTAKEQVAHEFGEEIAELVDGVSKIAQITFNSQAEAQAENFRKMMLAMVKDIRVILIKLADRLHNMRTISVLDNEKRRRIANETLEIYVPIANRLGMNSLRLELEDLGLAALYPTRSRVLKEVIRKARGNRKEIIQQIETSIKQRLCQEDFSCRVMGREKHLYSIYKKMKTKQLSFNEVFDVYAFRIVVDNFDTAYRVLGAMHNLYKPVPGKFKDYIAIPKANGYQSLHTVLFGPYGVPIEVQIRSEDMDKVAESGIAAHWFYKSGEGSAAISAEARTHKWLRSVIELQKNTGNSLEFIENVKIDLFPDEVYVFTPKGEILVLPRGATPVDFAYSVHSDVGNTCVACRVDRRLAPLRTPLYTGQTVEVITAPGAKPNPSWLNFVMTAKARTNIRSYLKNLQQEDAIILGRKLLDKTLAYASRKLEDFKKKEIKKMLKEYNYKEIDELYMDIGLGTRPAPLVARKLIPEEKSKKSKNKSAANKGRSNHPLLIKGSEGMVVSYAKCCHPIPGDAIVGFASTGKGIVIHTESCNNVADYKKLPDKWVEVEWEASTDSDFIAELRLDVANRRGVLAIIASSISDMDSNIENIFMEEKDGTTTSMNITVTVKNRQHLARIMRRVRTNKSVSRIVRKKG